MATLRNEQYIGLPQTPLHVFQDEQSEWQVWFNLDAAWSGFCIGTGDSADEAINNAVEYLRQATVALCKEYKA